MNKYIAELIGTFFLVLTIGCTVIGSGAGALARWRSIELVKRQRFSDVAAFYS